MKNQYLQIRNRKKKKDKEPEVRSEETWGWIRRGYLKKETENLIFAAQEKALRTNWIRKNIDEQEVSEKCGICWERVNQRHDNI